jgi:GT2 family glycosyltransferase
VLSFVIPVRNDAERLRHCLASIRRSLNGTPAQILVADNGSTDASADVARESGARVLSLPGRRVGEMRNVAAAEAHSELLAFVDADHEVGPEWVASALDAMRDPATTAAGDLCYAPTDATWVQQLYDRLRLHANGMHPVGWLGSGNLVVRRSAFEALGGFDTTLETCEDVDLCQRLTARGGRIMAVSGMVNLHFGDPATLRALFLGELWRGRDNLRVSLRAPLTLRSLPGVAIPILTLAGLVVLVGGLALMPWVGRWVAVAGAGTILLLFVPHTVLLVSRTPRAERGVWLVVRAFLFSVAYNAARALALLTRAGHRTRKAA